MPDVELNLREFSGFARFEEANLEYMSDWSAKGSAIAIIKGDQVAFSRGFGKRDIEQDLPVDSETIFAIGSTTKAFATATLAILVDRGILEWDRPLKDYIPSFALFDDFASQRISARDLVCHRSGLPRHDAMWYGTSFNRAELFERLRYLQPNRAFRTTFQYQNLMFMAAGYLVEVLTGQSWENFVQQEIFAPLEMTRTNTSVEQFAEMDNVALPYVKAGEGVRAVPYRNLDAISPAGSINSCLSDMSKWLVMQLNGGCWNGKQIISAENLKQTHTSTTIINQPHTRLLKAFKEVGPETYGLGWFIHSYRGKTLIRHGGHIDGFSTQVSIMPEEQLGVIVFANIGGSSYPYVPTFELYDRLLDIEPLSWNERILSTEQKNEAGMLAAKERSSRRKQNGTQPTHSLLDYCAQYQHPGYGELQVEMRDEKLFAFYNGIEFPLQHYHFDIFESSGEKTASVPLKFQFSLDVMGRIDNVCAALEPNVPAISFKRKNTSDEQLLTQFTGRYSTGDEAINVRQKKPGQLALSVFGEQYKELIPYSDSEFFVKDFEGWQVEFLQNEEGLWKKLELLMQNTLLTAEKKDVQG